MTASEEKVIMNMKVANNFLRPINLRANADNGEEGSSTSPASKNVT
jgi:hypothetical protein